MRIECLNCGRGQEASDDRPLFCPHCDSARILVEKLVICQCDICRAMRAAGEGQLHEDTRMVPAL